MIELMQHVTYLYDPVWTIDGQVQYFVYLKDGVWRVQEDNVDILKTKTPELVLDFLGEIGVDLEMWHSGLIYHVSTEATLHRMNLEKCEKLIGKATCKEAYNAWQSFGKNLGKEIKKLTTGLKVVE